MVHIFTQREVFEIGASGPAISTMLMYVVDGRVLKGKLTLEVRSGRVEVGFAANQSGLPPRPRRTVSQQ